MDDSNDIPYVFLKGSEDFWEAYDEGDKLERKFPDQCARDFVVGCTYNDWGPLCGGELGIVDFNMIQEGMNEEANWVWHVTLTDGSIWVAEGGCDYTGWDCQSNMDWERL